jgi:hypothetical protein
MQSLVLIKARRNEKDGKMYPLNISRRVFIYRFDRVAMQFHFGGGNSQLIILQN